MLSMVSHGRPNCGIVASRSFTSRTSRLVETPSNPPLLGRSRLEESGVSPTAHLADSPNLGLCKARISAHDHHHPRLQSAWPQEFETIRSSLQEILGGLALRIDHIGSTSVPGLGAKDVIDVQITVQALTPEVRQRLSRPATSIGKPSRTIMCRWARMTTQAVGEVLLQPAGRPAPRQYPRPGRGQPEPAVSPAVSRLSPRPPQLSPHGRADQTPDRQISRGRR